MKDEGRRGWRVVGLVVLGCFLLAGVGCREDGDTWEQIETGGVLRVGLDPTFPPFAAAEGPEVWGLDVDLARALAADLGLEPQFTYFGYDGLYDALATRQVDVLISAVVVAPERTQDVAYSDSYYDAGQVLVVPAHSTVGDVGDLAGQPVAVELGSLGHVAAQQRPRRRAELLIQTYDSTDEALAAVSRGEAAAAVVDSVSARLYLRDHPDAGLMRLPEPVTSEPYAMAVRIEERTLHRRLNESLRRLAASGQLEQIVARWLGH